MIEEKRLLDAFDNMFKSFISRNEAVMESRRISKDNINGNIFIEFIIAFDHDKTSRTKFIFSDDSYLLSIDQENCKTFDRSDVNQVKRIIMLSDLIKALDQVEHNLKYLLECAKGGWYKTLCDIKKIEETIVTINRSEVSKNLQLIEESIKIGSKIKHSESIDHFDRIFVGLGKIIKISDKFFTLETDTNKNKRFSKDLICRLIYENKLEVFE